MKILVLSDSHSSLRGMRLAMDRIQPDAVIHLGDFILDGESIAEEYPGIPFYQVAGNCDRYRESTDYPEIRVEVLGGIRVYMTHGHLHGVKQYTAMLSRDAQDCRANIAVFGHTHEPYCEEEAPGFWMMNPGSCGYGDGYIGVIEINDQKEIRCRNIRLTELGEQE